MARIPVLNPPTKKRRRVRRHKIKFKRKARHVKRRRVAVKNTAPKRTHRKRRHARRHPKKVRRNPKRGRKRARFNPFGSEMMLLGNPSRTGRKRRRKSMARHHKRSRRRRSALSNPMSAVKDILATPKEMVSKEFIMQAVATTAGFMLPNMVLSYLPAGFKNATWKLFGSKVLVVAGLSTAAGMVGQKKAARFVLIGGGVALLLDLWSLWQARSMPASPASAAGTSAYYGGDPSLGAYYGNDAGVGAFYDETANQF